MKQEKLSEDELYTILSTMSYRIIEVSCKAYYLDYNKLSERLQIKVNSSHYDLVGG